MSCPLHFTTVTCIQQKWKIFYFLSIPLRFISVQFLVFVLRIVTERLSGGGLSTIDISRLMPHTQTCKPCLTMFVM